MALARRWSARAAAAAPGTARTATCAAARGLRCAATSATGRCFACHATTCTTATRAERAIYGAPWTAWPEVGPMSQNSHRQPNGSRATLHTCRCRRHARKSRSSAPSVAVPLLATTSRRQKSTRGIRRFQRKSSRGQTSSAASSASWLADHCLPFLRRMKACRRHHVVAATTFPLIT